jgi:tetratricopeptide (TPR) repeat protein
MTQTKSTGGSIGASWQLCAGSIVAMALAATPVLATLAGETASPNLSTSVSTTEPASDASRLKKAADDALALGNYAGAQNLCTEALNALGRGNSGEESALRDTLAQAFFFQGKLKEAHKEVARALSLADKAFGPESLEAAREFDGMAWLCEAEHNPQKAQEYCIRALNIRQAKLAGNDANLADSLEHAGWLAERQGVYSDAAGYYEKALPIREFTSGAGSMSTADVLERLGVVKRLLGDAPGSQPLFARALAIKEGTKAVFQPYAPQPTDKRVVFRFSEGAPNCQVASSGGSWTERITASSVTVEASVASRPSEFVKTARARIKVLNDGSQDVFVLSQPPKFIVLAPRMQVARYLSADQLAQTIEEKGQRKATSVWRQGQEAVTPIYSDVWTPFGRFGSGSWHSETVTTMVPDLEARARAARRAAEISAKSLSDAGTTRSQALGPCLVAAGAAVQGGCDFDRCDFDNAVLSIPVGNAVFEFCFDRKKLW